MESFPKTLSCIDVTPLDDSQKAIFLLNTLVLGSSSTSATTVDSTVSSHTASRAELDEKISCSLWTELLQTDLQEPSADTSRYTRNTSPDVFLHYIWTWKLQPTVTHAVKISTLKPGKDPGITGNRRPIAMRNSDYRWLTCFTSDGRNTTWCLKREVDPQQC